MRLLKLDALVAMALLAVFLAPWQASAERPHPPGIRGTVPIVLFRLDGPSFIPVLPRIQVVSEHGRLVADVETVAEPAAYGFVGRFEIPLHRAGSYLVSVTGGVSALQFPVEVSRKEFTELELIWPPIPLPTVGLIR
jgi:hypothetical protein